jgi:hypothetical protein
MHKPRGQGDGYPSVSQQCGLFSPLLCAMSNQQPRRTVNQQWKGWDGWIKAIWDGFQGRSSSPQPAQDSHEGPQTTTGGARNQTPPQPIQHMEISPSDAQDAGVESTLSGFSTAEHHEAANDLGPQNGPNVAHIPDDSPLPANTPASK